MQSDIRFGVLTAQGPSWHDILSMWRHLDSLGVEALWMGDHFVDVDTPEAPWFDAWSLLSALATQIHRARIGILVSPVAYSNPVFVAKQAITLDHISNGRFELGLGAGVSADPSYRMLGLGNISEKERVAQFVESTEIINRLLTTSHVTFSGQFYQPIGTVMNPHAIQVPRMPLTIAALGPRMIRLAAKYADRWSSFNGTVSASTAIRLTHERYEQFALGCKEEGRNVHSTIRSLLAIGTVYDETPFASEQAFVDYVHAYHESGINEFVFYYPPQQYYPPSHVDQNAVFEKVVTEVLPRIQF